MQYLVLSDTQRNNPTGPNPSTILPPHYMYTVSCLTACISFIECMKTRLQHWRRPRCLASALGEFFVFNKWPVVGGCVISS